MSYILDALHKSDQERQEKQGPTLQTIHRPHIINKSQDSSPVLTIFIISTISLIILVSVWLFFPLQTGSIKLISESTPTPKNTNTIIEAVSPSILQKPLLKEPELANTQPNSDTKIPAKPEQSPHMLVHFWELPNSVQQEIPALTFSFHVFSENSERRTIIINKHRVKESEWVAKDLLLEEITKDGIILIWMDKYRFSINVVENW
ncbi:MAG: general secretion pathway protein B [Oceanicoccus sp.]|jgi:general secretion pathway protein B